MYCSIILHECASTVNRKISFGKNFESFCDKLGRDVLKKEDSRLKPPFRLIFTAPGDYIH